MAPTAETQTPSESPPAPTDRRAALGQRLFQGFLAASEMMTIYLGQRLGLYDALRAGPRTVAELARSASVHPRYAREWLEQQAVAGVLDVATPDADPQRRRYALPAEHADVLLEPENPAFVGFAPPMLTSVYQQANALRDAYRTGGGVPWSAYGEDMRLAQADQNRAFFRHFLTAKLLPGIPAVQARLTKPGARVADVACGAGHSSLAVARAYPGAAVEGFDLDAEALELGRAQAKREGLDARVRFHAVDAADPRAQGRFDLALIVEALHDLSHPVAVLRAMRGMLAPGGSVVVVDEKVEDAFAAPGSERERLFYGFSTLACLPNGLAEPDAAGTGTLMRPDTVRRYAKEAGFGGVEEVAVEHDFFRFYRLVP